MLILISIIIIVLLFVLLAVLTFARDLLATFLNAIVGFFRRLVGRGKEQNNTEGRHRGTVLLCSLSGDEPAYYAGFLCGDVHKRTVPLCHPCVKLQKKEHKRFIPLC